MPIIQIHDLEKQRTLLAVDLRHVLDLLGTRAARSLWEVGGVAREDEALVVAGEEAADRLEALAQSSGRISGKLLARLAHSVYQVIWGEFRAYDAQAESPWVIVRAIDSTWYEVETDDEQVLARIRSAFKDVRRSG